MPVHLLSLLLSLGPSSADASTSDIYYTTTRMDPFLSSGQLLHLSDGNVNAAYADPETSIGYLDGPELALFDGDQTDSEGCAVGVSTCSPVLSSDGHEDADGVTRPYWGDTTDARYAGTIYQTLRDAARDYFDTYNSLSTDIRDTDNAHELVVMINRPDDVCGGSCMRPHTEWWSGYKVFRGDRPDGRDGGTPYYDRPKIFLRTRYNTIQVPVHEFGHYYNRVMAVEYGTGGFDFDNRGEEKALDEGLGYWYSSDYAGIRMVGREGETGTAPTYSEWVDEPDEHYLGNVITYALWDIRQTTDCDPAGLRRAVFSLIDHTPGADWGEFDPFEAGSIMRGFSWELLTELRHSGACTASQARDAAAILESRELIPAGLVTQESTQATSEDGDNFGHALASGDFNGDGFADLVVTSPNEDSKNNDVGLVHIIYGSNDGIVSGETNSWERIDQASLGSSKETGDRFGWAVAAGDFDGDGYSDLAVGSPHEDLGGMDEAGFVHVFYGHSSGLAPSTGERISQSSLGSDSETGDHFGYSLAAGDFNGDGLDDLAIGRPGETLGTASEAGFVSVLLGSYAGLLPAAAEGIRQEDLGSTSEDGDRFGEVLTTGDFDGDGYADLAIGAPFEDLSGQVDAGFVWVVYGASYGIETSDRERMSQATIRSRREADDRFGSALAAGDFDGDGRDDLVVGAPGEDLRAGANVGHLVTVYGSAVGLLPASYAKWSQTAGGARNEAGDGFSATLAAGDIDGDGLDDLAVGIPMEDYSGAIDCGFVHVYYGRISRDLPTRVRRINARSFDLEVASDDRLGAAITMGDFNGDGIKRMAISMPGREVRGQTAGAVVAD